MTSRTADSTRAYIALGSNLGDSQTTLTRARRAIAAIAGVSKLQASSLYRSEPIGTEGMQNDYLNAVVCCDTTLAIEVLWMQLTQIEQQLGRVRTGERNAARTIDIDLLLYSQYTYQSATLTVPHPRITERAFVLLPLIEIDPSITIVGVGRAAHQLTGIAHQRIQRTTEPQQWI